MPYRPPAQHAITPQHRGRFPGFDVLDQAHLWDDVTAGTVLARLALPGALAFFTPTEVAVLAPLTDLLLAQDDEPRVPVVALIDARLAVGETDGWHYDDLPEDGQAWRDTLAHLDRDAHDRHHRGFAELTDTDRARLVQDVQDLAGSGGSWHDLTAKYVWSLWTRYATTAFYSHPWAWNEIGFPGPAYPRGYLNPGIGTREKWEVPDQPTGQHTGQHTGHHTGQHTDRPGDRPGGREHADPVPFAESVERARRADDDLHGRSNNASGRQHHHEGGC